MKRIHLIGIIIAILLIFGIGGAVNYYYSRKSSAPVSVQVPVTSPTPPSLVSKKWSDPNGFTFEYPDDVTIDKHDEDVQNYAHIEMTHTSHPGSLIVWAKDAPLTIKRKPVTTLDEWISSEDSLKDGTVVDTTFAGQDGKKVLIPGDIQKIVIGTVSEDIVFYIETTASDSAYWTKATEMVANSFTFTPLGGEQDQNTSAQSSDTGGYTESVDEEETLE